MKGAVAFSYRPKGGFMWIAKHLRLANAYSELETMATERTAELQKLSQRLLKVQDEERRKIARDLHDSTGQTLAALKINVSFLQATCQADPKARALVAEVESLADQAIQEIRTMTYLLHPPLLDEVGFASAAEWYVEGFAKRSGIEVSADFSKGPRMPKKMELALFRVLQESLTNAHRHSGAKSIQVNFQRKTQGVILEIRDFGRGISPERVTYLREANAKAGVGLSGMRERMYELTGTLEVESNGQGTTVRAIVPIFPLPQSIQREDDERAGAVPSEPRPEKIAAKSAVASKSASRDMNPQDSDLLARIGSGEQQAMASLYDRHSDVVYAVALKVCHDSASAEEILQNVFMQIWLAPRQFALAPGSLDARLGLLARNLATELMRKRKASQTKSSQAKSGQTGEQPSPTRPFDPIPHVEVGRLMRKPHALVLLLPDADRRVLEMAFFDGKTRVEIAEETGLPVDMIGGRVRHALSVLRNGAGAASVSEDTGLEVLDLDTHSEFAARRLHPRDLSLQMEGLRRLTHSFVRSPETILQELVNAAVDLCGADSAGISFETKEKSDANYYQWVAAAGQYNAFLNAALPRYPSACGICLERGKPQLFRVGQRFFDMLGIEAPLVTDGILLPWQVDETRGTIFIMAHGRTEAFDKDDGQMMRVLADFAAMAVRHQRQQQALLQQAKAAAGAEMAKRLAHTIDNPLQSLMQLAHLAAEGQSDLDAKTLGQQFSADLQRLSALATESLAPSGDRPD